MGSQTLQRPCKDPAKGAERSKTAQGRSRTPQEPTRDDQKASLRASGNVFGRLLTRLERHLGLLGIVFRGDFEIKIKIDSGNADFRKSMLSPRREHRL